MHDENAAQHGMRLVGMTAALALSLVLTIPPALSNAVTATDQAAVQAASRAASKFQEFPLATATAAASKAEAVAWLIRQGDKTQIRFAAGPSFEPHTLFSTDDHDGRPVTDLKVSPDGRFVVFTTGASFAGEHPYNPASLLTPLGPELWFVATTGAGAAATPQARRIGPGIGAVFAPDGERFLYVHGADLHLVTLGDAAGGVTADDQVAAANGASFSNIQWAADGQSFAFTQDRGGYAFLGLFRLGADRVQWLVTQPERLAAPVWSPDGTRIAYLAFAGREHTRAYDMTEAVPASVNVVEVASGRSQRLWQSSEPTTPMYREDGDSALRWSSNQRLVFFSEHDGWGRLYGLNATGGQPLALTPGNCEVAESELLGVDELFVLHNCVDINTRQASVVNARSGKQTAVRSADDKVMALAVALGGGRVALAGGDANTAPLLRILDVKSGKAVVREGTRAYGYRYEFVAAEPQAVTFKAEDGVTVPAQVFVPRTKGKHAALIFVHGGPQRQMFPAFHYAEYYARNYAFSRRLADMGYVVLSVNYRSGTGYGRAFRDAEGRGWRAASEYRDVVAGAKWLAARDDVDAKRIGIWGGSYGGLLTGQALARNSDLFAAGVAVHGVFDWSWPTPTPFGLNASGFFGVSDATRQQAFEASPLAAIDRWKSPVLLFSGDQDMNVDVRETVDLAQKLKARGVEVKTVLVPGEAHGFVRNATWVELWQELSAFFAQRLGGGT